MKKYIFSVFILTYLAAVAVATPTFQKGKPVRQHGKEEGMLLDLGKISMGTLNDVEEKKQYLSTVQLEKQRIQNYTLRMVYENAYLLYKQGDYQRAQEMAQTILSIDPNFKQAKTLAWQAQNMGTYGTSSEAQVIESKFQEAGRLYESGRLIEANDKLNEILTIRPGNARAISWKRQIDTEISREYARRGYEAEKAGDYQKALDAWYNALLMRKDDPRLVSKIAEAENKLRKQQVEESMRQALDFYNKEQYAESYAVFERIMKIQPGDPRVQKYMSQLRNEIAAGYYTAGNRSYNANRFDQAVAYWNNAKKWGADENTIEGLIKQARDSKERFLRMEKERIQREQYEREHPQQAKPEEPPVPTTPEPEPIFVGPEPGIPGPSDPGVTPLPTPAPGAVTSDPTLVQPEPLPNLNPPINRVTADAAAASRDKFREGMDAYNQDDYERARAAWTMAKQLDPGNSDAEMGLRKLEELMMN